MSSNKARGKMKMKKDLTSMASFSTKRTLLTTQKLLVHQWHRLPLSFQKKQIKCLNKLSIQEEMEVQSGSMIR